MIDNKYQSIFFCFLLTSIHLEMRLLCFIAALKGSYCFISNVHLSTTDCNSEMLPYTEVRTETLIIEATV